MEVYKITCKEVPLEHGVNRNDSETDVVLGQNHRSCV